MTLMHAGPVIVCRPKPDAWRHGNKKRIFRAIRVVLRELSVLPNNCVLTTAHRYLRLLPRFPAGYHRLHLN